MGFWKSPDGSTQAIVHHADGDPLIAMMSTGFSDSAHNAYFVAAARDDIPRLVALVERLSEVLEMRPNDGRSGRCGIRLSNDSWCVLNYRHDGEHE